MKKRVIKQTITEQSTRILLQRGLQKVEGGYIFRRYPRMSVPSLDNLSWEDQLQLSHEVVLDD